MSGRKVAVVLFNLGGPDGPRSVEPFLFNLFNDPAIIGLPDFIRPHLARFISRRRAPGARGNYALMGGGSPLLPETRKQADALQALLTTALPGDEVRCFIAMRYWKPLTEETAARVADFGPDEILLLPLYPQFSTTTTGSSLKAWREAYKGPGRSRTVCCWPAGESFLAAHARLIEQAYEAAGRPAKARLLFSAHGLPEKVIKGGDPYQAQVEATAAAVAARLSGDWDWRVSYQSRVGPMKWIGPNTEDEIRAASKEGLPLVIVPIAFVSEHIETLVELDIEYAEVAKHEGCPAYIRVPALGVDSLFIAGLAGVATQALRREGLDSDGSYRCAGFGNCPRAA
ncbi:ferrochelatase [Caulobacter sp. NIBR1757]|uniref:ferrochelatase n=1 Tax=Caulobacter sp. NIBR1757 TaxID=3016000 RepID=UPI0027A8ED24|nr:Ferrochelatase [Caulobacter sp. NIBR1757]